jgi:hypothetical protein
VVVVAAAKCFYISSDPDATSKSSHHLHASNC